MMLNTKKCNSFLFWADYFKGAMGDLKKQSAESKNVQNLQEASKSR